MSSMSNIHLAIAEDINRGDISYRSIADKYGVPQYFVDDIAEEMKTFCDELDPIED
jgi:hypothetical protein